jgi:hypothetical protein
MGPGKGGTAGIRLFAMSWISLRRSRWSVDNRAVGGGSVDFRSVSLFSSDAEGNNETNQGPLPQQRACGYLSAS